MQRNFYDPNSCSWYRFNLDVSDALLPEFLEFVKTASRDIHMYFFLPGQIFHDSWITRVQHSHGLDIDNVMVFVGQRNNPDPIAHVDGPSIPLRSAINWCLGEDHQPMQWFSLPEIITRPYNDTGYYWNVDRLGNRTRTQTIEDSLDEIDHKTWYCSELTQIDQCLIGSQPTLVRVDQPHNVAQGHSDRVSISIRCRPLTRPWRDTVADLFRFILPD